MPVIFMSGIRITLAILGIPIPAKRDRNPLNANVFLSVNSFLSWGSRAGLLLFSLPFYPYEKRQDRAHNNTAQNTEENDDGERSLKLPEKKRDGYWGSILHGEDSNDQNNDESNCNVNHGLILPFFFIPHVAAG
jgi:hypothetical protein